MYYYFAEAYKKEQQQKRLKYKYTQNNGSKLEVRKDFQTRDLKGMEKNSSYSQRQPIVSERQPLEERQQKIIVQENIPSRQSVKVTQKTNIKPTQQNQNIPTQTLENHQGFSPQFFPQQNQQQSQNSQSYRNNEPQAIKVQDNTPEEYVDQPLKLFECPQGCGRKFNEQALKKHTKVCKKVFQDTREVFDSKTKREADGIEEIVNLPPPKKQKGKLENQNQSKPQKKNWKDQSEAFRAIIKHAKNPDSKLSAEEEEKIKKASQIDLVQCDFCGRKFNETAAAKHIPFCKQQQLKKGKK